MIISALTILAGRRDNSTAALSNTQARETQAPVEVANPLLSTVAEAAPNPSSTQKLATTLAVARTVAEPVVGPAAVGNRAKINEVYRALFWDMQLPPEKQETLITLLLDLREAGTDFAAAGAGLGVDVTSDPTKFNQSVRAQRAQIHAEIAELVGPDRLRQFLAFEKELKIKSYAVVLQRMLKHTASPLTTQQADELTRVIEQGRVDPKGDQLISEASQFLSAEQLDALRQLQDRKIEGHKKPNIRRAIREGAGPQIPGAVPP